MPIYEFLCQACGGRTSVLARSVGQPVQAVCEHCGGTRLERAVSTFAVTRSVKDVHQATGPVPAQPGLDYYRDPRNIGRRAEEAFQRFGVPVPDSVRETIAAARDGDIPKDVRL